MDQKFALWSTFYPLLLPEDDQNRKNMANVQYLKYVKHVKA